MTRVEADYEDGVFKPLEDPGLNDHERVVISVERKVRKHYPDRPKQRTFGSAKGLIKSMSDDFDEPFELVAEEDLAAWSKEMEELARRIPQDDFDRIDAALAEADREAKELVRQQMGKA